ncbi:MAG TPA: UDP-glucose 4-epimerase GalE [Roseiarcus sp.]|nr:UDP-glucose 4-epimerase GalE [Roseiarcus sp.]
MRAILVTGGAGYVGSHCCKHLHRAGYLPVVVDNLDTGHRDFVRWGPFEQGDVRNRDFMLGVIDRYRPEAAMHFAAKSLVAESVQAPGLYYDNNIGGTLSLLECLKAKGVMKLVFSSSCAIYGPKDGLIAEDTRKGPLSPYGFSKLVCEQMMDDFDRAHGLKSVRLRYFNAAGADPEAEIGEHHATETHLVPIALDVALGLRERLQVYGTDYPTPDRSAVRDYIHVLDLASAHEKALDYLAASGPSAAFNLGTGAGSSVLEIVKAAEAVTGRPIPIEEAPRRPGDAPALVADPSEARKRLGWTTDHSGLPEILADAWRWHQARFSRKSDRR